MALKPGLSAFLDLSRWLAALLVLVSHVRNLLFADLPAVPGAGWALKLFYGLTGLGHQAVVVFFVVSGFLVGGVTLQRWGEHGPELRRYCTARVSRIYTVLVPALLLGGALDLLGATFFDRDGLYARGLSGLHIESLTDLGAHALGWRALLGNLLSLQGIVVPTYGTNGPLWSLAYEWWYYVAFALLAGAWFHPRWRVAGGLAALALLALLPGRVVLWGALWVLGAATHHWTRREARQPHWSLGLVALAGALAWSRVHHPATLAGEFGTDALLAAAYCLLIAGVARRARELPLAGLHRRAADFSYSLYLSHFPALVFVTALASSRLGMAYRAQPTAAGFAVFAGLTALLLLYAYLVAQLTERHSPAVRRRLDAAWDAALQRVPPNLSR